MLQRDVSATLKPRDGGATDWHPRVVIAMDKSTQIMERLFVFYLRDPDRLSAAYRQRASDVGSQRAVADYIAGMTDRYAEALDRTGPGC